MGWASRARPLFGRCARQLRTTRIRGAIRGAACSSGPGVRDRDEAVGALEPDRHQAPRALGRWRQSALTRGGIQQRVIESGLQGKGIETFFDLIEYDEGRDPAATQPWKG